MRCLQTPKPERVVQGRISNNRLVHGGDTFSCFLLVKGHAKLYAREAKTPQRDVPSARVAQTNRGQEKERVKSYGSCTCLLPFMNQQVISMTITGPPSAIGFGIIVRETSL